MRLQYNRVIFIGLCTSVLFASSWNRGYPPLLFHRRTPLIPKYNQFPIQFNQQFSSQPRSRQDDLTMPQQDQMFPTYMDISENSIYDDNYSTAETLEKPFLTEPVFHENYTDAINPEESSPVADDKKTNDNYNYSNDNYHKYHKYKDQVSPPRPPPVPDYPTVPILPMFYLVDEPNHYDYDYHYPYPHQEEKKKEEESKKETTTLAPFTIADVKVPAPFLRIETMICFTILGLCYGLGFLVLFQSLCVPAAKLAVALVYIVLLKKGLVEPVTLEQALQQLPPT